MGKSIHDDVLDAALNYIKTNGDRISICNAEPTTYTQAITTYKLAIKTISASDYTGPANGDVSGRKITVNQQSGITVDAGGTASHVAIADSVNSKLLLVTTCTPQALVLGNSVTIPAFKDEIADPA